MLGYAYHMRGPVTALDKEGYLARLMEEDVARVRYVVLATVGQV
jgi:hypothetical protein